MIVSFDLDETIFINSEKVPAETELLFLLNRL